MKKNIYMDSAASWLKPDSVIKAQVDFMTNYYANAGRGICARAGHVDDLIAESRQIVADFIGAEPENIVFVSGATDALNRVVNILTTQPGYSDLSNFAVSDLDHHSARLPWENLWHDAKIRKKFVCDLDENLNIDVNSIPKTDYLTITAMSNVLGVKQDVASIIKVAKQKNPNVITIVDASQYVVHEKINVKEWDCDFLAFSGHKIGADTGIGVLYIKEPDKYFPDKFGGGMINKIIDSEESSQWIYNKVPEKFEAGTLPLTQIVGLKYAIMELEKWNGGKDLINYMYSELSKIPNIKLITSKDACMISFVVKNMHVIDFGALIGTNNICVRVGNMCASWIHKKLDIDGSVRLSVGPWNTMDECEYVINTIKELVK